MLPNKSTQTQARYRPWQSREIVRTSLCNFISALYTSLILSNANLEAGMKRLVRSLARQCRRWMEGRGAARLRSRKPDLERLEFFHSCYIDVPACHCPGWLSPENILHFDAPLAVVVKRKGKLAGVVGFEILGSTILIRQLQGAPKASFHDGTSAQAYLLDCAEHIAKALRMRTIRIVDADTAIAYREASPIEDRPSEIAKTHMRRNYSYPAEVGYTQQYFWRLRRTTYFRSLDREGTRLAETPS